MNTNLGVRAAELETIIAEKRQAISSAIIRGLPVGPAAAEIAALEAEAAAVADATAQAQLDAARAAADRAALLRDRTERRTQAAKLNKAALAHFTALYALLQELDQVQPIGDALFSTGFQLAVRGEYELLKTWHRELLK